VELEEIKTKDNFEEYPLYERKDEDYLVSREGENESEYLHVVRPNPVRRNGWVLTTFLLLMDCIGTGVLTIPYAFKRVGWWPAMFGMISLCLIARYTGVLLCNQAVKYPNTSHTYGKLAEHYFNKWGAQVVFYSLYVAIFFGLAYYQLVISKAIQGMFYSSPICLWHAGLLGSAIQLPLIQLRTLHDVGKILSVISLLTIMIVLIICVAVAGLNSPVGETSAFRIVSVYELMGATSTMLFSYTGHGIYLELMYEMKKPEEFIYSLNIAYSAMAIIYLSVGILTYYFIKDGVPGYLLDVIEKGEVKAVTSSLLLIHVLSICVLRYQVLIRAIHRWLHSESVDALEKKNPNYCYGRGIWISLSISILFITYLSANSIPFFIDFVELIASLCDPWFAIAAPCLFQWLLITRNYGYISWGDRLRFWGLVSLSFSVVVFGTGDALTNYMKKTAQIWTCFLDD